jgi:hypothetical protein
LKILKKPIAARLRRLYAANGWGGKGTVPKHRNGGQTPAMAYK